MNLKVGIIAKDIDFIHYIKDILHTLPNLEIASFNQNKEFDFILIDYDNAKDLYESLIPLNILKNIKIVIISKQVLLNYMQPSNSVTPIIFHPDEIPVKLVQLLLKASSSECILIRSQRDYYKLRFYDILMVYPENHYLNFVMENQTVKSRISINEISNLLESHGFAISKASTYVNIHRIISISKTKVLLDGGKHTSISRYKYEALIKKFKEDV